MKRHISFLATDPEGTGHARLVRGTYQSTILVQWGRAEQQLRSVDVALVRFD
jgi:hypothetical protein